MVRNSVRPEAYKLVWEVARGVPNIMHMLNAVSYY